MTSTAAELNILDGVTATTAELNILDGVTSTAAELNILDGKAFLDEDDMSSNSATGIASQQSIKAYVDAQITAEDLDFQADSGGALSIDLDSETLTFTGGTGIDTSGSGNAVTFAIDSTVATLTGSQTLTNKSLTAPTLTGTAVVASLDISGDIDVDGTTNLDAVDIDGAVDFASTTAHAGNASFADNAKAIFGAGSDLQIFHDGSNSFISDQGTGHLKLLAGDFRLNNAADDAQMISAVTGGAVNLYHNNNPKFATTSTGADITGVLTADGATIDGDVTINSTTLKVSGNFPQLFFEDTAGSDVDAYIVNNANGLFIGKTNSPSGSNDIIGIDLSTGGVVFNEPGADAGFRVEGDNQANLFVIEASSDQVGVGTSPSFPFHVSSTDSIVGVIDSDNDSGTYLYIRNSDATTGRTVNLGFAPANNIEGARILAEAMEDFSSSANRTADLAFQTRKDGTLAERVRIKAAGEIQIGGTTNAGFIDFDGTNLQLNTQRNPNTGAFVNSSKSHAFIGLQGTNGGSTITFGTASSNNTTSTSRMIIESGGNVEITNGNLKMNSGNGIDFSDTSNSDQSMSSELLADYEEGTWTATVNYGTSSGTAASLANSGGSYTRVGRLVTAHAEIDVSSTNSGSGTVYVGGLPFAVADIISPTGVEASGIISYYTDFSSAVNSLRCRAENTTKFMTIDCNTSATQTSSSTLTAAIMGTGEIRLSITYFAS